MAAYAIFYGVLSWQRFATFHAQIDMSYYLRLIWGIGHGHPDLPLVKAPHFLGLHLEPIVFPLAALSALGIPLAPLLLGLQAVAVAALAWPAYRLARRHLLSNQAWQAGLYALAALLYPTVTVATLHDFHPVTLALAPLLGVIDALDQGRRVRAVFLGALCLSFREDIALQLAVVALAESLRLPGAARRLGLFLCLGLVAYFSIYVLLIQPRYLPPAGSYGLHFGALSQALGEPGGRSESGRALLFLAGRHPFLLLRYLLTQDRLAYPLVLLWPVAFLPLLRPRYLLGALPVIAINLLSDFPRVRTIEAHYATALVPFLLGPAILGGTRATQILSSFSLSSLRPLSSLRSPRFLSSLRFLPLFAILLFSVLSQVRHGASPISWRSPRFAWSDFRDAPDAAALRAAIAAVPPEASVAAAPGPLAHLCQRERALSPPEYDDGKPVEVTVAIGKDRK